MGLVYITVTLDWDAMENEDAFVEGIKEIAAFHEAYPLAPITHFICPLYFVKDLSKANNRSFARKLFSTKHEMAQKAPEAVADDEIALHVHCWHSLVRACDVGPVLDGPSYYGSEEGPTMAREGIEKDVGHGVLLGAYSRQNIRKLLRKSKEMLTTALEPSVPIVGFRCGGWMASDEVIAAVAEERFLYDASALDAGFVGDNFEDYPVLAKYLKAIWGPDPTYNGPAKNVDIIRKAYPKGFVICDIQKKLFSLQGMLEAQPREICGDLVEVPDTGLLADYSDVNPMLFHLEAAAKLAKDQDVYVSIGFHFQGTSNFEKIMKVVGTVYKKDPFHFATVADVARRFMKRMFRLTITAPALNKTLRDLPYEQRASLNKNPQDIVVVGVKGQVPAVHWAWEQGLVIRIECTQDLVALHQQKALVAIFAAPHFQLPVAAVVAV